MYIYICIVMSLCHKYTETYTDHILLLSFGGITACARHSSFRAAQHGHHGTYSEIMCTLTLPSSELT